MAHKFVGIDLGTHEVKVVVVTSGLRGIQVVKQWIEPVVLGPEGDDSLEAAVAVAISVLRKRDLLRETIGVALPGGLVSYRLLRFPFSDARRIAQAVPFEAEGQFPIGLEQLRYDHLPVAGTSTNEGLAFVVAAHRDRIQLVTRGFEDAAANLKLVTAGPIAAAQALSIELPPAVEKDKDAPQSAALVVDIGHRTTDLLALGAEGPLACRTLRSGARDVTEAIANAYNLDLDEAEEAKRKDAFVPHHGFAEISAEQMESGRVVARALESLVREVEHTRLWLRSSFGYEIVKIYLTGGGSSLTGLDLYLTEQTGLPVDQAVPGVRGLRGVEDRDWRSSLTALGTAVATSRRALIELYDAAAAHGDASWLRDRMPGLVGIAVALMAFGALDTIAQANALDAEREAHREALAEAANAVFGTRLTDPAVVQARLKEVEEADLMSLVPKRGALEVLAMISEAAAPQDTGEEAEADSPGADMGAAAMPPMAAIGADAGGDEDDGGGTDSEGDAAAAPLQPITDPTKGIFRDDELTFSVVDIRERKVELAASATRSSAQDRLQMKLQQTGCLTNISKGKVSDRNERKVFEMSMDNACFVEVPEEETE